VLVVCIYLVLFGFIYFILFYIFKLTFTPLNAADRAIEEEILLITFGTKSDASVETGISYISFSCSSNLANYQSMKGGERKKEEEEEGEKGEGRGKRERRNGSDNFGKI
jgi:hypothetical protein